MGTKLYVGNLPFAISMEELQDMFSEVGTVVSAQVVTDRDTGRSRGFGFVEMSTQEEADQAVSRFDQSQFKGRAITVNEARPRAERSDRPGGGGGGRRDFGSRNRY